MQYRNRSAPAATSMPATLRLLAPHPALAPYVAHYWASWGAPGHSHTILPDGCVDLVVTGGSAHAAASVYGSTLSARAVPVRPGADYVGVRFLPGQARHFTRLPAACLTDVEVQAGIAMPWASCLGELGPAEAAARLDHALLGWLSRGPGLRPGPVEHTLARLRAGAPTSAGEALGRLAALTGTGLRQAERQWHAALGMPMQAYLGILRVRRAAYWLSRSALPLAEVAARAGYADQSHLSRAVRRYLGVTPLQLRRAPDVGIVQDSHFHVDAS